MPRISFQTKSCCFLAEFNNSLTARDIITHLPLDAVISTWGDEIYFEAGIIVSCDDGALSSEVEAGDVAYWPRGRCICVFFGPTPMSKTERPQPASPVIIIGKTKSGPSELRKIKPGDPVSVAQVQENVSTAHQSAPVPDRKLTQKEIDVLVRQLLTEKAGKS